MSWDSYKDNLIAHSKDNKGAATVDKCCIIGVDGSAWTSPGPNGLNLAPEERSTICAAMKHNDISCFQASGIKVEGVKYLFLREEDGKTVLGKKKGEGAVTLQKSKTAIVIAHTTEGCQQGNSNKAVGTIADYLESLNM